MLNATLAEWSWKAPELPINNWWFIGVVLVLLVFVIWLIARLTTSASDDIDPAEIDRQMLTSVSELHSQGELTPDEYRSIKGRLVERLSEKSTSAGSDDSSPRGQSRKQFQGPSNQTTEDPSGSLTPEEPATTDSTGSESESHNNQEDKKDD